MCANIGPIKYVYYKCVLSVCIVVNYRNIIDCIDKGKTQWWWRVEGVWLGAISLCLFTLFNSIDTFTLFWLHIYFVYSIS